MNDKPLTRQVSRREFNQASLSALFVGMTVWVGACGKSGSSASAYPTSPSSTPTSSGTTPSGTSTPASSDKSAAIGSNHGHVATVTAVQLAAAGGVTLHLQGTADHDHTVDLSAAEVGQVAAGTRVSKNSTSDGGVSDGYGGTTGAHAHTVTFN